MIHNVKAAIEGTLLVRDGMGVVRMSGRFEATQEDMWAALTDVRRLGLWYGTVEGDPKVGSKLSLSVFASGWKGKVRVDVCEPQSRLELTMWPDEGTSHVLSAELEVDGRHIRLALERGGVPLDLLWAFGAGWHEHLEDLGAHLAGQDCADWSTRGETRFDELAPKYREMALAAL